MDFVHLNQPRGVGKGFPKGLEEKSTVSFLCIFSLFLRPWVVRERRASVYSWGSPGSDSGLWSPNIPELLGTSGSEAWRPDGSSAVCESTVSLTASFVVSMWLCLCLCSVSEALSNSPEKFPCGRDSAPVTGEGSLELLWEFSEPCGWGGAGPRDSSACRDRGCTWMADL